MAEQVKHSEKVLSQVKALAENYAEEISRKAEAEDKRFYDLINRQTMADVLYKAFILPTSKNSKIEHACTLTAGSIARWLSNDAECCQLFAKYFYGIRALRDSELCEVIITEALDNAPFALQLQKATNPEEFDRKVVDSTHRHDHYLHYEKMSDEELDKLLERKEKLLGSPALTMVQNPDGTFESEPIRKD